MSVTCQSPIRRLLQLPMLAAGVGAVVLICASASCGPTGQERYEQRLANTGKPSLHAIQNDRLRELMGSMNYSMTLDPPERETEPVRRAQQIAEVAKAMADTVSHIPDTSKEIQLDDSHRAVFNSLVEKLRAQALTIQNEASRKNYNGIDSAIEEMQSTCNACHVLFRHRPAMTK